MKKLLVLLALTLTIASCKKDQVNNCYFISDRLIEYQETGAVRYMEVHYNSTDHTSDTINISPFNPDSNDLLKIGSEVCN